MRGRGRAIPSAQTAEDRSQSFLLSCLVVYLDRLLARYPRLDYETLETLHWVMGLEIQEDDLLPLVSMVDAGGRRRRGEWGEVDEIRHSRDFANVMEESLAKANKDDYRSVVGLFKGLLEKRRDQLKYSGKSDVEKNLDAFQQMFGLTELEKEICLFFLTLAVFEEAQNLFEHELRCDRYAGRGYLAAILGTTLSELSNVLDGKLYRIGILEPDHRLISLEPEFLRILQSAGATTLETEFFKRIEPDVLPLDEHNVEPDVTDHALRLLSPENEKGCALLLYGNPGSGKTTFSYAVGRELGLEIYLCKHEGKKEAWKHRAAVMASANMASQNRNALLIVDDCDSILGTRHLWTRFGNYNDKKWLHEVLESCARMIFIVNDALLIEESVIRRFSFSIHFKPFSRGQRILLWKNILQGQKIDLGLTDSEISDLASRHDVSPGVINMAVETASVSKGDFYKAIRMNLEAHESLSHGGRKPARRNPVDKNFILDGLNIVGTDLNALLKDLEAFDKHRKKSSESPPGCSILCYGPSGTGKSHLARHIAHVLDKEAVIRRGSDLLSAYVGQTEANIRDAYEAAEAKGILIIDEAESLVFSRDRAHRSWEFSFTNEFLNCMEEYKDIIQIFTTNRLSDMDSASLRRFDYKLEFGFLKPAGIMLFYNKMLCPLFGADLQKSHENELQSIQGLAPGDFNVVRSRHRFKAKAEISHEALIAALREEARTKDIHAGRKVIGF